MQATEIMPFIFSHHKTPSKAETGQGANLLTLKFSREYAMVSPVFTLNNALHTVDVKSASSLKTVDELLLIKRSPTAD